MSMPLENARLCLDCDTVFDEPRCPSCSSETFFPLGRWVRPHTGPAPETPPPQTSPAANHATRNASLLLAGSGVAYALWRFLKAPVDSERSTRKDGKTPPPPSSRG